MDKDFKEVILEATGAQKLYEMEMIQELWSGYGKILRYGLEGTDRGSVVVKHVQLPKKDRHPRGWNTGLSHKRKLRSYRVEIAWYKQWSKMSTPASPLPRCLATDYKSDEFLIVLEDLNESGFPKRKSSVGWKDMEKCLSWLANFHATYMGESPDNLWKTGTYWHLATRPDELKVLTDKPLKDAAQAIDRKLRESPYQTFVHGDAKLANFCFSWNGDKVAAVDFQYVGGGCGMKDVAYFVGSCLYEEECGSKESMILDYYFKELKAALKAQNRPFDGDAVEADWRPLYHVAWADFHRFLKGWSPGHWKINSYSEKVCRKVIEELGQECNR